MILEIQIGDQRPVSYSAYDMHGQCPKKFQLIRVIGVPEDPAIYFAAGTTVHLATAVIDLLMERGRTAEEAVAEVAELAQNPGLEIAQQEMAN